MAGLFAVAGGPDGMAALDRIMGPSYDYAGHIKSPTEMGMSAKGTFPQLADNVSGLLGYVTLLIGGDCSRGIGECASKRLNVNGRYAGDYGKPLGNQFFLETPVKCKDIATDQDVTRSIYVNNIPDGRIPLVSDMTGVSFDDFKGIMPGIMSNIAQINPMQILMSFVTGTSTACQMVTMPTMDVNDNRGTDRRYITNGDIKAMPDNWFSGGVPPKSSYNTTDPEGFQSMNGGNVQPATSANLESSPLKGSKIDYSKMPNDVVIKFYYSMLGLLGLYMLLRLMIRKKNK